MNSKLAIAILICASSLLPGVAADGKNDLPSKDSHKKLDKHKRARENQRTRKHTNKSKHDVANFDDFPASTRVGSQKDVEEFRDGHRSDVSGVDAKPYRPDFITPRQPH